MGLNLRGVVDRLDALNEYDREPVPQDKLQGAGNFAGFFAGEHVAGTEFVIGPLFVAHGASAFDMFVGLFLGNLLAVLSWTFVTTPIAVRTRLNLYWHLRQIAGPYLLFAYNIVNALMFCFLAGSMISVSATAIGLPFEMRMPDLADRYPNSLGWVLVILGVGLVVTLVAILGFEKLAHFSKVAAPWMFLVFVGAGLGRAAEPWRAFARRFLARGQREDLDGRAPRWSDEVHLLARALLRVVLQPRDAPRDVGPDDDALRPSALVWPAERVRHVPRPLCRVVGVGDPLRCGAGKRRSRSDCVPRCGYRGRSSAWSWRA